MLKEFKEFAMRGNVVDMAVGIVIGAAFGKIISSLVADVIMPPIGQLMNGINFEDLFYALDGKEYESLAAAKELGAPTVNYGVFINTVISFLIVAFAIFLLIKQMNRFKKAEEKPAPTTHPCSYCQTEIPLKASRCPHCTSEVQPAS